MEGSLEKPKWISNVRFLRITDAQKALRGLEMISPNASVGIINEGAAWKLVADRGRGKGCGWIPFFNTFLDGFAAATERTVLHD